ncbi:hypothetical protein EIQ31_09280 [Agrobacterium deltaense]|nr:hypothetical protein EIQ31_09280 [Agrobacterium deltaense]
MVPGRQLSRRYPWACPKDITTPTKSQRCRSSAQGRESLNSISHLASIFFWRLCRNAPISLVTHLTNYNIPTYTKMYINHRGYAD